MRRGPWNIALWATDMPTTEINGNLDREMRGEECAFTEGSVPPSLSVLSLCDSLQRAVLANVMLPECLDSTEAPIDLTTRCLFIFPDDCSFTHVYSLRT